MAKEEPPTKRNCKDDVMKIGTHSGSFHCDEVLACYLLKLLPKYQNAEIVRTRDPKVLDACDIVVDVGGVYDPDKNRFDHHQRSFNETMNSIKPKKKWTTKLSSAGLIYCHFGEEIIKILLGKEKEHASNIIYDKMYENFVEEIDAIDNGINQYDGEVRYKMTTGISARVGHFNSKWNEEKPDDRKGFDKAMEMVGEEFKERVQSYSHVWLPARSIVEQALRNRFDIDASGEVVLFETSCPWKEHLFDLEEEMEGVHVKYVLYSDSAGKWRIQCVPAGRQTFVNRLSILPEWQGLRDDELTNKSGIPGCIFVHATGFIGGNETRKGVLEMAKRCLRQERT